MALDYTEKTWKLLYLFDLDLESIVNMSIKWHELDEELRDELPEYEKKCEDILKSEDKD